MPKTCVATPNVEAGRPGGPDLHTRCPPGIVRPPRRTVAAQRRATVSDKPPLNTDQRKNIRPRNKLGMAQRRAPRSTPDMRAPVATPLRSARRPERRLLVRE